MRNNHLEAFFVMAGLDLAIHPRCTACEEAGGCPEQVPGMTR